MKKQPLIERFQQLAGIKPLYKLDEADDWQKRQDALTPGKNPEKFFGGLDKLRGSNSELLDAIETVKQVKAGPERKAAMAIILDAAKAKTGESPRTLKQALQFLDLEDIDQDSNNGEIEIDLEDLTFETLKEAFPNKYQQEKFTRPQTNEPYYSDSISFPNLDDSMMEIGDSSALEDWKDKVNRRFGNVTIILKPDGKNWFDKVFVADEKFNQERDNFISGKMSALNK